MKTMNAVDLVLAMALVSALGLTEGKTNHDVETMPRRSGIDAIQTMPLLHPRDLVRFQRALPNSDNGSLALLAATGSQKKP